MLEQGTYRAAGRGVQTSVMLPCVTDREIDDALHMLVRVIRRKDKDEKDQSSLNL